MFPGFRRAQRQQLPTKLLTGGIIIPVVERYTRGGIRACMEIQGMSGDVGLNMYEQSFHYQSELLASNLHSEYNHNQLSSRQHLRTIVQSFITYRTDSTFQMRYEIGMLSLVFPTLQFICPRGRTRRTTGGSLSFFESMDRLGEMELGADALLGPVGPVGLFCFGLFCLYAQKLQVRDFISLIVYDLANHVAYV